VSAVERPIVPSVVLPARAWAPPNRWIYALAVGIAMIVLEASSRGSWVMFILGEMVGMGLLAVWLYRLLPTLIHRRLRLPLRDWLLWIGLPTIVIATHYAFLSPFPFEARLGASRPGMNQAAARIMVDADAAPGWIGLYPVDRIDRYETGFRFLIWGSGFLDPVGFAYASEGEPPIVGEDRYEPIGDGWWHWTESW
jgi:hypothetical protein